MYTTLEAALVAVALFFLFGISGLVIFAAGYWWYGKYQAAWSEGDDEQCEKLAKGFLIAAVVIIVLRVLVYLAALTPLMFFYRLWS